MIHDLVDLLTTFHEEVGQMADDSEVEEAIMGDLTQDNTSQAEVWVARTTTSEEEENHSLKEEQTIQGSCKKLYATIVAK